MEQKVILKIDVHDDTNCKKKVMKLVSSIPGVESISVDMKEKKVTVIGDMDPVSVVKKLRKTYYTEIVTVGPAKEPAKPTKIPENLEPPKPVVQVIDHVHPLQVYCPSSRTLYCHPPYYSVEEDPTVCVIC